MYLFLIFRRKTRWFNRLHNNYVDKTVVILDLKLDDVRSQVTPSLICNRLKAWFYFTNSKSKKTTENFRIALILGPFLLNLKVQEVIFVDELVIIVHICEDWQVFVGTWFKNVSCEEHMQCSWK